MRTNILAVLLMGLTNYTFAQDPNARPREWTATVNVLDEGDMPVKHASVTIGYYVPPRETSVAMAKIVGTTDTNGIFSTTHSDFSVLYDFSITKEGYYPAFRQLSLGDDPSKRHPELTMLLKKVGQPIPMYAKWVNLGVPILGKPVGFDLTIGDWVMPNGKGVENDLFFTAKLDKRSEHDWDSKLTVSFPNSGDGIQQFTISELEKESGLRSPHEAPATGYEPQWVKARSQRPGESSEYGLDENLNFFIRVRTVLDEHGNVKSALYGKIYGDFMKFRYYLNPTPNDRNVEFDPKQNLLKNLKPAEQVNAP